MGALKVEELAVLLVEPSRVQQMVLAAQLAELGARSVAPVADGAAALERLRGGGFDLVVSTMHLPDMTGADLVLRLRADPDLATTPFMLVCSETSFRYLEPVRQAGAVAILHKPVDLGRLRRALNAVLDLISPEDLAAYHPEIEGFHVLVVDDMASSRMMIRMVLEGLGIVDISEAENGARAMEVLDAEDFDLVVTDYHMPEVDGAELVRFIREQGRQPDIPILMVTSERDQARLHAIQQTGVSAVCDKPFEPAMVRELLERIAAFGHA